MIEVRPSSIHGRGVFATQPIRAGDTFHVAQLLVFGCEDQPGLSQTVAAHYVFYVEDCADAPGRDVTALAMSPISFVNHRRPCNTAYVVHPRDRVATFTAMADIAAGDEITIDYGDFADRLGIA